MDGKHGALDSFRGISRHEKRHRYSSYSVFYEIYLFWGRISERAITNGNIGYVNRVVLFLNQIVT